MQRNELLIYLQMKHVFNRDFERIEVFGICLSLPAIVLTTTHPEPEEVGELSLLNPQGRGELAQGDEEDQKVGRKFVFGGVPVHREVKQDRQACLLSTAPLCSGSFCPVVWRCGRRV